MDLGSEIWISDLIDLMNCIEYDYYDIIIKIIIYLNELYHYCLKMDSKICVVVNNWKSNKMMSYFMIRINYCKKNKMMNISLN